MSSMKKVISISYQTFRIAVFKYKFNLNTDKIIYYSNKLNDINNSDNINISEEILISKFKLGFKINSNDNITKNSKCDSKYHSTYHILNCDIT